MERLPPEVWDNIFSYLHDFNDLQSASDTCTYWSNILKDSKSSWMFPQVLPVVFLTYLSKSDILQCRLVCKHWSSGVDYFLENNTFHRPTFQEENKYTGNELCSKKLQKKLLVENLVWHPTCTGVGPTRIMMNMIVDAGLHPRCPIIGRSVCVTETAYFMENPPNKEYLEAFGKHIYFLHIRLQNMFADEYMERILELLKHVPNLKKLVICTIMPRGPLSDHTGFSMCQLESGQVRFPTLETLHMDCELPLEYRNWMLGMFFDNNLKSLHLDVMQELPARHGECLEEFSVGVNSDTDCQQLMQLRGPLRKLILRLCKPLSSTILFQAVKQFNSTLEYLQVKVHSDHYGYELSPPDEMIGRLQEFANQDVLKDFPNLKIVSWKGMGPLFLNFLCGLKRSLEYLYVSRLYFRNDLLQPVAHHLGFTEEIDLLEKFKQVNIPEKPVIYGSNLWKLFPKLRVLTLEPRDEKWNFVEYTRIAYDERRFKNMPGSSSSPTV